MTSVTQRPEAPLVQEQHSESEIRRVIDPHGTLPLIRLEPLPRLDKPGNSSHWYDIVHNDQAVGIVSIKHDTEQHERSFSYIQLEPKHRKKGLGLATYLAAIEDAHANGDSFRTDKLFSRRALRVWDRFIRSGVAEVVEPVSLAWSTMSFGHPIRKSLMREGYIRIPVPRKPGLHT